MTLGSTLTASSELADRARQIAPVTDACAGYGDAHGQLAPDVVAQMHDGGIFSMWTPEELNGAELDPVRSLEVIENLAYGDASAGWVAMAANLSIGTAGAFLADNAVAELFGSGSRPVIAGQGTRPGVAKQTDGGLQLTGSWSFGSGLLHSTHVHSLGIVEDTGEPRIFVTPIDSATIDGNWNVMGLKGTGSVDYRIDSYLVPEGWSHFAVTDQPLRGGNLFRLGIIGFAVLGHSGWAMGVARRMLDELATMTREKAARPGGLTESTAFLQQYAESVASLFAARELSLAAWRDVWASLEGGAGSISVRQHTMVRLALTNLTKVLQEVATMVYLASGTTGLRDGSPLQRCFRDVHAGTQHVTSAPFVWHNAGRELLGLAEGKHWQFLDLA